MFGVTSIGTTVNDMLGVVGIKGAGIGIAIDSLTGNSAGVLANLHDQYLETARGRGTGPISRRMMSGGMAMGMPGMAPMGFVPSPGAMMPTMAPFCGCGYSGYQKMDLAPGSSNVPFFSSAFDPNRRMAGRFERMLRHNPVARAQFESSIGGRITNFGLRNDGKFTVQRFHGGCAPGFSGMGAFSPFSMGAFSHMGSLTAGVAGLGVGLLTKNPLMGLMAGGLGMMLGGGISSSIFGGGMLGGLGLGGMMPGLAGGFGGAFGMQGAAGFGWGPFDNTGAMGGRGFGSWNPNAMPGKINNTNPRYESAHQAQVSGVLADPSLTVEDKVVLMMMLITKKMDRDIERQAQYINSIQQQQANKGGGGKGGGKGGGGKGFMGIGGGKGSGATPGSGSSGNNSPSIDIESMKLKRMVDKRSQMFDILRQIIDKYNQTAKSMIDSIGR